VLDSQIVACGSAFGCGTVSSLRAKDSIGPMGSSELVFAGRVDADGGQCGREELRGLSGAVGRGVRGDQLLPGRAGEEDRLPTNVLAAGAGRELHADYTYPFDDHRR
jgi:hypothetical protein